MARVETEGRLREDAFKTGKIPETDRITAAFSKA
jgi:hypothetical protein